MKNQSKNLYATIAASKGITPEIAALEGNSSFDAMHQSPPPPALSSLTTTGTRHSAK